MNHEETEFAAWRFAQRTARDVRYFYAGRHFKPEHQGFPWGWVVCIAGVVLCAWLASQAV